MSLNSQGRIPPLPRSSLIDRVLLPPGQQVHPCRHLSFESSLRPISVATRATSLVHHLQRSFSASQGKQMADAVVMPSAAAHVEVLPKQKGRRSSKKATVAAALPSGTVAVPAPAPAAAQLGEMTEGSTTGTPQPQAPQQASGHRQKRAKVVPAAKQEAGLPSPAAVPAAEAPTVAVVVPKRAPAPKRQRKVKAEAAAAPQLPTDPLAAAAPSAEQYHPPLPEPSAETAADAAQAGIVPPQASKPKRQRKARAGPAAAQPPAAEPVVAPAVKQEADLLASLPEPAVDAAADAAEAGLAPPQAAKPKQPRSRKAKPAAQPAATAAEDEPGLPACSPRKTRAKAAVKAEPVDVVEDDAEFVPAAPKPRRSRAKRAAVPKTEVEQLPQGSQAADGSQADPAQATPKPRRRKAGDPPDYPIPGVELLEAAYNAPPAEPPVPNLGYCCLNMDLREMKPAVFTSRGCIKKTYQEKGLPYISSLALENAHNLPAMMKWNRDNGIHLFRLSSEFFPWCTEYELKDLPDYEAIAAKFTFAGDLARAWKMRLTFHPSHFVKLAAQEAELLRRSKHELEVHSQVFDMMGFKPSHYNKINIHIGGVYNDKQATLARFAETFRTLSPNLRARLTVENDDWPSAFAVSDLMWLHKETGIPLVFDFHHWKFCPGGQTQEEAFRDALTTWHPGVRPIVHWSESQAGRKPHAHSDYIKGPMDLYGMDKEVDVMIEAKAKERALLCFRDHKPIPEVVPASVASVPDE